MHFIRPNGYQTAANCVLTHRSLMCLLSQGFFLLGSTAYRLNLGSPTAADFVCGRSRCYPQLITAVFFTFALLFPTFVKTTLGLVCSVAARLVSESKYGVSSLRGDLTRYLT